MIDKHLVNRHIANVAIQFGAYAAPIEQITKYVALSLGADAPELPELQLYLRKESTHKVLAADFEVGLWCGPGERWRLVSLSTPPTLEAIEHRLSHYPASVSTQCSYCLIDERNHYATELIKIYDLHGEPMQRRLVHRACYKPFMVMVNQYERANKGISA